MFLISALLLCGVLTCATANDLCLNKTEYDFYMMENLMNDFEYRIQSLKQKVKEVVTAKCSEKPCQDDWVSYDGYCYFFENARTYNFNEARAFCKERGSVLLYVKDGAENAFIARMLKRLKSTRHWYWTN